MESISSLHTLIPIDPTRDIRFHYELLVDGTLVDIFEQAKQKCYPAELNDENKLFAIEKIKYHFVIPFSIKDRDGPSFQDKRLRNLIIDSENKLLKLVFETGSAGEVPKGLRKIKTLEYLNPDGVLVARKFDSYI